MAPLVRADQLDGPQDFTRSDVKGFFSETRTTAIRLWAPWPAWQPDKPDSSLTTAQIFAQIDANPLAQRVAEQVRQAKQAGYVVILTSYKFPRWTNATTDAELAAKGKIAGTTGQDNPNQVYAYYDRAYKTQLTKPLKGLDFGWPTVSSISSPWGIWMQYLCSRYGSASPQGSPVDFLEPLNEPNKQCWPQQPVSQTSDPWAEPAQTSGFGSTCLGASLIQTAQVAQQAQAGPVLLAPATLDVQGNSRSQTDFTYFEQDMLAQLKSLNFHADARIGWSIHNYGDVLLDRVQGATLAEQSRTRLTTYRGSSGAPVFWTGWPNGSASSAQLAITEGGALWDQVLEKYPTADPYLKQSALIQRSASRMKAATGIPITAQYLFYSDTAFDSGLRDAPNGSPPYSGSPPHPSTNGDPRDSYSRWLGIHNDGTVI